MSTSIPTSPDGSPQGPAEVAVCKPGLDAAAGPLGNGLLILGFLVCSRAFLPVGGAEAGRLIAAGSLSDVLSRSRSEFCAAPETRSNKLRLCLGCVGGSRFGCCTGLASCTGAGTEAE